MTGTPHPRAFATVTGPTATFTTPDGRSEPITPGPGEDIRHAVVRRASDEARATGTPVELVTSGDRGTHHLLVDATGTLTPVDDAPPDDALVRAEEEELEPIEALVSRRHREEVRSETPHPPADTPDDGAGAEPPADEVTDDAVAETPARPTFLTPNADIVPVATGWRAVLARLGITVPPSRVELERAGWVGTVSRQWAGCRILAVANGKGGVGKTMSSAMLAAVYARNGGGNVLAWDNNDTRGTLGWRTEQGLYDTTLRDLLPAAPGLLAQSAGVSDVARYVHHQATDRYDVLRSNPELLATDQRLTAEDFDLIMQVAARYYRLVVVDSGNDESADRWQRMVDGSHQLIVPTLATPESAESAALLLDALRGRDDRSADLAAGAVVIVTQAEPQTGRVAAEIADRFRPHVRDVAIIPFDPALKSGALRFDALHPTTRDAWLRAAAAAASTL